MRFANGEICQVVVGEMCLTEDKQYDLRLKRVCSKVIRNQVTDHSVSINISASMCPCVTFIAYLPSKEAFLSLLIRVFRDNLWLANRNCAALPSLNSEYGKVVCPGGLMYVCVPYQLSFSL